MSDLLKNIDARTRLAGTNKLEISSPWVSMRVPGVVDFRHQRVQGARGHAHAEHHRCARYAVGCRGYGQPARSAGPSGRPGALRGMACDSAREIMIVTEYNGHTQVSWSRPVDTILRLDWAQMRVPPDMMTANLGGLVTAVTELGDNRLVMMLDVEKVLAETTPP